MKKETLFVCQNCGHSTGKWLGKCSECGEWNSLVEEKSQPVRRTGGRNAFKLRDVSAVPFTEIESQDDVRIPSGVTEFDRVLGGGIVPGSLVLLGGEPGIGKSTLLLQAAARLEEEAAQDFVVAPPEGGVELRARGTARRNPDDPAQPQIGEEIAAARALSDLVHQLLDKAATQIEEATHKPAHLSV